MLFVKDKAVGTVNNEQGNKLASINQVPFSGDFNSVVDNLVISFVSQLTCLLS